MGTEKRILLVEDDEDTCAMLSALFELDGHTLMAARTLAAAARIIDEKRFDLYILDNWLPDGTGVDLCERIRAIRPTTPVIFYSGVASQVERDKAIRAGAQAYLVKPTGIQTLEWVVSALLSSPLAA